MSIWGIALLAVSLSMDALGIGISYGVRGIRITRATKWIICAVSTAIMAASILLGSLILMVMSAQTAKWVGFLMLCALGLFFIAQGLFRRPDKPRAKPKKETILNLMIHSLGITITIMRNPITCDFDQSKELDAFEAVYLGVALSIDSFGVGVSSAISGLNSMAVPVAAGICQLLFLCLGALLGGRIAGLCKVGAHVWNILSGVLLILLACLRFFL